MSALESCWSQGRVNLGGIFDIGASGETSQRDAIIKSKIAGVEVAAGQLASEFKPARIKCYRLAEGFESKTLRDMSYVYVGQRSEAMAYRVDSPIPLAFEKATTDAWCEKTIQELNGRQLSFTEVAVLESSVEPSLRIWKSH